MFVCVCVCAYKRCIHVVSLLHKVEWCSSVMNPRAILRITTNRFQESKLFPGTQRTITEAQCYKLAF